MKSVKEQIKDKLWVEQLIILSRYFNFIFRFNDIVWRKIVFNYSDQVWNQVRLRIKP